MKKIFKKIVIGSLVISAALGILAVLFDIDSELGGKVLLSTMVIFPFSMAGLCCSSIYEKEKLKWFSTIGIIVCVLSCLYFLGLIWDIFDLCILFCEEDTDFEWKLFGTAIVLPACLAQQSLLLSYNCTDNTAKTIQKGTTILSIIIAILIFDGIWTQLLVFLYNEITGKLVIIALILIAVGTLLTRILSRPNKKLDIVKDIINYNILDDINEHTLTCPKCNNTIESHWKFCPNCNNQLIEEPKTCPNCNTKVEKEWNFCPNCNTNLVEKKEKQSE